MPNTASGKTGERAVAAYLEKRGYTLLEMNFRSRFGEVDVIAENDRFIVFVEVKTRDVAAIAHPFAAITRGKQQKIIRTVRYYLLIHPTKLQPRFDAAAVFTENGRVKDIEYLENAFY